jgi:hypothetical protein
VPEPVRAQEAAVWQQAEREAARYE